MEVDYVDTFRIPNRKIPQFTYLGVVMNGQLDAGCPRVVDDFNPNRQRGGRLTPP